MRNIIVTLSLLLFFIGCGDTNNPVNDTPKSVDIVVNKKTLTIGEDNVIELSFTSNYPTHNHKWYINGTPFSEEESPSLETPKEEKIYTITLTVEDDIGTLLETSTDIEVKASDIPTYPYDASFSTIQSLISNADSTGLTYICYGDSTRTDVYENHYVFENVKEGLASHNVSAINMSVTGIYAKQAAGGMADGIYSSSDWSEVAQAISGTGATTILNISSIGLNDYGEFSNEEIKSDIKKVITLIRGQKPNTHFILTVPSRTYYDAENMSNALISIYQDLSNELGIPYINVPDEAMPLDELTLDWYRPGDQTHLARDIQVAIANLILSKILP